MSDYRKMATAAGIAAEADAMAKDDLCRLFQASLDPVVQAAVLEKFEFQMAQAGYDITAKCDPDERRRNLAGARRFRLQIEMERREKEAAEEKERADRAALIEEVCGSSCSSTVCPLHP